MVQIALTVPAQHEFDTALRDAIEQRVASRIAAQDATLWGPDAESEASIRLSWTQLPEASRPLVAEIAELREQLAAKGLDRVVLCGMGGSSLAPEVICDTAGVPLTVLDSSQPDMVRAAIADESRAHDRGRLEQVRRHGRDRQPAAGVRAGVQRRRPRPRRPHRRGHRSGLAARRRGHQGRLSRVPRRSARRWPLLGADGVRAGPERSRRRRHRCAARRGRRCRGRALCRRRRQPRRCGSAC